MRYSSLRQGVREIRRVSLPLARSPFGDQPALPEVGIRSLTVGEAADAIAGAREFAQARGVKEPKEGDAAFELGLALNTVLIGCVDPDDPAHPPFFDSLEQLQGAHDLGVDAILLLNEHIQTWQGLLTHGLKSLRAEDVDEYLEAITGSNGLDFFMRLRPGTRWTLVLSMARLLRICLLSKSSTTSDSDGSGNTAGARGLTDAGDRVVAAETKTDAVP